MEAGDAVEKETLQEQYIQEHKEDLQRLRGLRLLDDDFMSVVFQDIPCTELMLRIILNRHDLNVIQVISQYDMKNLQGRSARLDIFATDGDGKKYNVEVQRSDKGAVTKRARYNSSLIDANITEPGEEYEALPESYVIFITEKDVMQAGLPIYHIDRVVAETGTLFGDESHIIYVNAMIRDETELGKLMQDFWCTEAADMNYSILANRVRYFKEETEGIRSMCRAMEEMRNDAVKRNKIEIAVELLALGDSYEKIARVTKLSIEEVKELDKPKTA